MTSVLIRTDASRVIGNMHVERCRTLARELKRRGANVTFLCRRQSGDLIDRLESEFAVLSLPEIQLLDCEGLVGHDLYRAWLGCSQAEDASECLRALDSAGITQASWLVVDHYGLDASWEAQVQQGIAGDAEFTNTRLIAIDDLANRQHQADLLIDQNFCGRAAEYRYQGLVNEHCRQLLGPHYALVEKEFAQLRPLVPPRTDLQRVLVYFGEQDARSITRLTLEALMHPALAHLAVDVVLEGRSIDERRVEEIVARRPHTFIHRTVAGVAGLIARADLAIGDIGSACWEKVILRLPTLVVTVRKDQEPAAQALEQQGSVLWLGDCETLTTQKLSSALMAQMLSFSTAWGQPPELTDGWGASRIASAMLGIQGTINLQRASATDKALLLRWEYGASDQVSSFSENPISPYEDQNWDHPGVIDSNQLFLIATAADGCPIGHIRFDRQSVHGPDNSSEALITVSLDRCIRGEGLAADVLCLGIQALEQYWRVGMKSMPGELTKDQASNACFIRKGFAEESIAHLLRPTSSYQSSSMPPGRITLITDQNSWINKYLPKLMQGLWCRGHALRWIHQPAQLTRGDVCLLLSCSHLLNSENLGLHSHNLVVHESGLPRGKGWSPMTWQILGGSNVIPISLFEATEELDAGPIYLQEQIILEGNELVDEWRSLQAQKTIELCLRWLDCYKDVVAGAQFQDGEPSYYQRRRPQDSRLDPSLSLIKQFNLIRVVDNERYPAFFYWLGRRYTLEVRSEPQ